MPYSKKVQAALTFAAQLFLLAGCARPIGPYESEISPIVTPSRQSDEYEVHRIWSLDDLIHAFSSTLEPEDVLERTKKLMNRHYNITLEVYGERTIDNPYTFISSAKQDLTLIEITRSDIFNISETVHYAFIVDEKLNVFSMHRFIGDSDIIERSWSQEDEELSSDGWILLSQAQSTFPDYFFNRFPEISPDPPHFHYDELAMNPSVP